MSDIDISNGTCYTAAGERLGDDFIPCGNTAFGYQTCCGRGDNCLANNACFGIHGSGYGSYLTYLGGCTDPNYSDGTCPDKRVDQPWVALTLCDNSEAWAICSQPGNPATLQAGASCSCTNTASATVAFVDATVLANIASLPQNEGGTISWFPGQSPTGTPTAAAGGPSGNSGATTGSAGTGSAATATPGSSGSSGQSGSASRTSSGASQTSAGAGASGGASGAEGSSGSGSGGSSSIGTGAIVGIVVGIVGAIILAIIAFILYRRRKRRQIKHVPGTHIRDSALSTAPLNEKPPPSRPAKPAKPAMSEKAALAAAAAATPTAAAARPATPPYPEADGRPISEMEDQAPKPWMLRSELDGQSARSSKLGHEKDESTTSLTPSMAELPGDIRRPHSGFMPKDDERVAPFMPAPGSSWKNTQ